MWAERPSIYSLDIQEMFFTIPSCKSQMHGLENVLFFQMNRDLEPRVLLRFAF